MIRVVLITTPWQPAAAQMAWRLLRSGADLAVVFERQDRRFFPFKNFRGFLKLLFRAGIPRTASWLSQALQTRLQFYLRRYLKKHYTNSIYRSVEELALDYPVQILNPETLFDLPPDAGFVLRARRPSQEIIDKARLGFYGIHLGDMEKYGGADPVFRALAAEDPSVTASVYRFPGKNQNGGIMAERPIRVFPLDDCETLREKALWLATYLAVQTLNEAASGVAAPVKPFSPRVSFSWPSSKIRRSLEQRLKKEMKKTPEPAAGPRVLHVITRMVRGGAQKNTHATVNGLSQKGYAVTLVSGPSWGNEDEILHEALEQNVELLILPELVREVNPFADLKAIFKLRDLIRRYAFTIVHTHTSKAGFLGRIAARWAKTPWVLHTPHGHVFHSYFAAWKEWIFLRCERFLAPRTHRLIALTAQCRDEHLELGVGRPEQWAVIPSGVDEKSIEDFSSCRNEILDSLNIPRSRKIIGYIGRLAPVKGCFFLIQALLPIYWAKFDFHCIIAGDGEDRGELEKMAVGIGLKGRVTFVGYQKDVSKFLSAFDILVVPSLNEGMGRVIVEAGFLAKPVVAAGVGGILDLIENEKTGFLVPPRNSDRIAGAIITLLENPAKAAEMGKALQKYILQGFTETQMVEKIHQLYEELLGRPAAQEPVLKEAAHKNQLDNARV